MQETFCEIRRESNLQLETVTQRYQGERLLNFKIK